MKRTAVYPGTFDPMTNGHVDLIRRGCHIFDRVLVAVLIDTEKAPLFTVEERLHMIRAIFRREPKVVVKSFSGLLVEFMRKENARIVVRGLRVVSDFEHEFQMALMNRRLGPEVETLFLTPKEELSYTSSRLVKQVHQLGGDVSGLVPAVVHRALDQEAAEATRLGALTRSDPRELPECLRDRVGHGARPARRVEKQVLRLSFGGERAVRRGRPRTGTCSPGSSARSSGPGLSRCRRSARRGGSARAPR